MIITVYSAKGSAGKTPISTNIALDREYAIGTNEVFNLYNTFIPDDNLITVDPDERFPDIPKNIDIVFDLAGSISKSSFSITSALEQSDLVIIPIYNEVKSLYAGVQTVLEVQNFTQNILVVATKLKKKKNDIMPKIETPLNYKGQFFDWTQCDDYKTIRSWLDKDVPQVQSLPLKFSSAFDSIFEKEASIRQIMANDPLSNHAFREVAKQFDDIYSFMDTYAK